MRRPRKYKTSQSASLIGRERLRNVQKMNERAKRASYCFSMLNMQICVIAPYIMLTWKELEKN